MPRRLLAAAPGSMPRAQASTWAGPGGGGGGGRGGGGAAPSPAGASPPADGGRPASASAGGAGGASGAPAPGGATEPADASPAGAFAHVATGSEHQLRKLRDIFGDLPTLVRFLAMQTRCQQVLCGTAPSARGSHAVPLRARVCGQRALRARRRGPSARTARSRHPRRAAPRAPPRVPRRATHPTARPPARRPARLGAPPHRAPPLPRRPCRAAAPVGL